MSLNFPNAPTDGQIYVNYRWNASIGAWQSVNTLNAILTPSLGDTIVYNGTNWVNTPQSGNAIINGNFEIWQRGTSFSNPDTGSYTADRFRLVYNGTGATRTISRQQFLPGDLEIPGYGSPDFYARFNQSVAGSDGTFNNFEQRIEDVKTFANQQVTLSFWAKAASTTTLGVGFLQVFGSGGSANVPFGTGNITLTTSWVKYTRTATVPSVSGKTVGADSSLRVVLSAPSNATFTIDLWGVQLESGPTATPFKLAGGGRHGAELALCQRYYYRFDATTASFRYANGYNTSTTAAVFTVPYPVTMRVEPTALEQNGTSAHYGVQHGNFTVTNLTTVPAHIAATRHNATLSATVASGLTAGQGSMLISNNSSSHLAWSAEL